MDDLSSKSEISKNNPKIIRIKYSGVKGIKVKKTANNIQSIYFNFPKLTTRLFPFVFFNHLIVSICLNMPAYFKKAGVLHFNEVGQFMSLYYWGGLIGAILGGYLTLYRRSTSISGLGLLILSLCLLVNFNTYNYWAILYSMFFMGLFASTTATSNIASLVKSVKENEKTRLKVISMDLVLFNVSFSMAAYLLLYLSIESLYLVVCIISGCLIFAGLWSMMGLKQEEFLPAKVIEKNSRLSPDFKFDFIIMTVLIFCFGLIFSMVKVVFTPTLIERFGSNYLSVIVASINPWMVFIFQPIIVDRIKSTNSTWFLGFGGLTVGTCYFIFGNVNSFILTALSLVMLTFGEMMFAPLSKHINIQIFGKGKEGVAAGVWKSVFLGSGAVGAGVSGYIAEYYSIQSIWEVCFFLGIICFIFSHFLRKIRNKRNVNLLILNS